MILNVVSPLLPSCWGYSFALGCGVSFFGVIQHSPVDGCSAASCNFGVLTKDENISFYSTTLLSRKDIFFIIGDWNVKVGSQKIPGVTGKFGLRVQNEAGQRLTEFCQENILVIANTLFQQYRKRLYTWTSPDGQHRNQIEYILCSQKWRCSIQSAKARPGADCSSDHELLIAKFRLKLTKVGKTTRPFRYDLVKSLMTMQWK